MPPPELTDEQRRAALEKAARARRVRAEVKELMRMGTITFPELLDRAKSDELIAGMKIGSVLPALPKIGKVKAKRLLEEHGIADNRRLRALTDRQRTELLEVLS